MHVLTPELRSHTLDGNLTSLFGKENSYMFVEYFDNVNYNLASQPKGY